MQAPSSSELQTRWRARLEALLLRHWMRRSWLALLLLPLSGLYGGLVALRAWAYRWGFKTRTRLPVPVIVVGNRVAGGAGKTPVVMALVQGLKDLGLQPGVISRGYGRQNEHSEAAPLAVHAHSSASQVGDEPLLLAQRCWVPVYVHRQRVWAGQALLREHPQVNVLVADDGLQHWALAHDASICVWDERGLGNGWLLPAGPLREPGPGVATWHVGPAQLPIPGLIPLQRALAAQLTHPKAQALSWAEWKAQHEGRPIVAWAAIAQSEKFFAMLRAQGLPHLHTQAFPDHHDYAQAKPSDLPEEAVLICTEKDAVKLWPLGFEAWAVPLDLHLPESFWCSLKAWVGTLAEARTPPARL